VVLVTGGSSGIGRAICDRLGRAGGRVYGGSRTPCAPECWTYLRLDVTDDASVEAAVAEIVRREGRIDALVCCAGVSLAGPVEDTTVEEAQRHFDVNFFGSVRTIRAVLPIMRSRRRGRIVVIGSIGGLIGLPYLGYYSATKFALDGLIEAMRAEVAPFGIEAAVLHPGDFDTSLGQRRTYSRATDARSPYFATFERMRAFHAGMERQGRSPDAVARKVERMLASRRLPVRALVGSPLEVLGVWGKALLPSRSFEFLFCRAYGPRPWGRGQAARAEPDPQP